MKIFLFCPLYLVLLKLTQGQKVLLVVSLGSHQKETGTSVLMPGHSVSVLHECDSLPTVAVLSIYFCHELEHKMNLNNCIIPFFLGMLMWDSLVEQVMQKYSSKANCINIFVQS
jgi:hypothetical protein